MKVFLIADDLTGEKQEEIMSSKKKFKTRKVFINVGLKLEAVF